MVKLPREVSLPGLGRKLVNADDEEEEDQENGNKDVACDKIKIMMMMMRDIAARAGEEEEGNKNQEDGEGVACEKIMMMIRRPNLELAWRKLSTARVTREPRIVKPTCTRSS